MGVCGRFYIDAGGGQVARVGHYRATLLEAAALSSGPILGLHLE